MRKSLPFALFLPFLTACLPKPAVAPIEQVQQETKVVEQAVREVAKKTVKDRTLAYQCKNQRTVRVTYTANDKKTINVEFNQTSHKLSSSLPKSTQNKRKYSNIRWIWSEDFNGKSTLRDKSGKVLAENCVKK